MLADHQPSPYNHRELGNTWSLIGRGVLEKKLGGMHQLCAELDLLPPRKVGVPSVVAKRSPTFVTEHMGCSGF